MFLESRFTALLILDNRRVVLLLGTQRVASVVVRPWGRGLPLAGTGQTSAASQSNSICPKKLLELAFAGRSLAHLSAEQFRNPLELVVR